MEDYSFYSSPPLSTKPVANSKATGEEESGWTAYFQDFSDHQQEQEQEQHEEQSLCSSFAATSSMVSDAGSHAAWRISRGGHNHVGAGDVGSPKAPIKLSLKKTRTKQISAHDDSLEDTASSPANSPKVYTHTYIHIYKLR